MTATTERGACDLRPSTRHQASGEPEWRIDHGRSPHGRAYRAVALSSARQASHSARCGHQPPGLVSGQLAIEMRAEQLAEMLLPVTTPTLTQQAAPTVDSAAHRADRSRCRLGDLCIVQADDITQHDRHAKLIGQRSQRGLYVVGKLFEGESLVGARPASGHPVDVVAHQVERAALAPAHVVEERSSRCGSTSPPSSPAGTWRGPRCTRTSTSWTRSCVVVVAGEPIGHRVRNRPCSRAT